jgi:hypothetical protein
VSVCVCVCGSAVVGLVVLEALDNLSNASHLVEFDLKLIDFTENGAETSDFGVGHLHGVSCAVVLHLGCCLCLLRELAPALVSLVHRSRPAALR